MTHPLQTLIVDDSIHMRKLLALALNLAGNFVVTEAKDGAQGLDELQQRRFDFVITAADMPLIDGFRLVELIRADRRQMDVPVLVIAGAISGDDRAQLLALGASDVLEKPLSAQTVIATVKGLFNI